MSNFILSSFIHLFLDIVQRGIISYSQKHNFPTEAETASSVSVCYVSEGPDVTRDKLCDHRISVSVFERRVMWQME